jgi:hypothetical protein
VRSLLGDWLRFVKRSFGLGWGWFTRIGNHLGSAFLLVPAATSLLVSWRTQNWWLAAFVALVLLFIVFTVGAYLEWRKTDRAIAEFLSPMLGATLEQLRGERGRANNWLGTLREAGPNREAAEKEAGNIEWLCDTFWLQTLELIIKQRSAPLWDAFSNPDHAAEELESLPKDERERVFRKVQGAINRLDVVIAAYEDALESLEKELER